VEAQTGLAPGTPDAGTPSLRESWVRDDQLWFGVKYGLNTPTVAYANPNRQHKPNTPDGKQIIYFNLPYVVNTIM